MRKIHTILMVCVLALLMGASTGMAQERAREIWSSNRSQGLSGMQNAQAHWNKHKSEFPEYKTMEEYVTAAHLIIGSPPKGTLTKMEEDGDKLFYYPKANIFVVSTPRGVPRTMFKPRKGKAYFDAQ